MALCAFLKARGRGIKAEMKGSSAVIRPPWGVPYHTEVYDRQTEVVRWETPIRCSLSASPPQAEPCWRRACSLLRSKELEESLRLSPRQNVRHRTEEPLNSKCQGQAVARKGPKGPELRPSPISA